MSNDNIKALSKTTPGVMREPRQTGITASTTHVLNLGRVNSVYVVASAPCWLLFSTSESAHSFAKEPNATIDSDDSLELQHPGGGASFPIIQESEATYLHILAVSGTVDIKAYPGGVTNP